MAIFRGRGGDGGTAAQAALTEVAALLDQATNISNDINADALLVDAAVVDAQAASTDASTSATNAAVSASAAATSATTAATSATAAATSETNAANAASTAATDAANLAAASVAAQTSADATAAANSAAAAATSETNSAASAAAAAASAALADEMVNIEVNVDATSTDVGNYDVNLVELTRTNFGNVGKAYNDSIFSNDGTILLLLDNIGNTIDSFTLSTPYDVSGLSLANATQTSDPNGTSTISFDFSPDGLYYYAASGTSVTRFTLTTPYDVSTALETAATAPSISTGLSMSSITVLESIQSIAVSPFGAGERIRILSIGDFANWAPPTLLQSNELVPNLTRNNLDRGRISKDGLYWIGTERIADYIAVAAFSTAYDVTTQTEVNETVGVITDPDGANFTNDPLKYVASVYDSSGDDEVVTFEIPLKTVTSLTALTNEFAVIDGTNFDIKSDTLTLNGAALESGGTEIIGTSIFSRNADVTTGVGSVGIGVDADCAGTSAVAVGNNARSNGLGSVGIGLNSNGNANNTVAIGNSAVATGTQSISIGNVASAQASSAVVIGDSARSTAQEAVALGFNADVTATAAIAIGADSEAGSSCVTVGHDAIGENNDVSVGNNANRFKTSGGFSVSVGGDSRTGNGTFNVSVGYNSGSNMTGTGGNNVLIGAGANVLSSSTVDGTAVGQGSTTNSLSVAVGHNAQGNNGTQCVSIGADSIGRPNGTAVGYATDGGADSVAIGHSVVARQFDTFVGAAAGSAKTSGTANTGLGRYDWTNHATVSNYVILSDGSGNIRLEINDLGNGTFNGNFTATGNVTSNSDRRLKSNIEVIPDAMSKVEQLSGYTFDMYGTRRAGVIAQEVEEVLPEVVNTTEMGVKSVAYGNLTALLIEAVKELKAEVRDLKERLGE